MEWYLGKFMATARVARDKTWHKITKGYWSGGKPTRMSPEHSMWTELRSFWDHEPTLVCPGLYLGNACHAANWKLLQDLNITCIVNVTDEISDYFKDNSPLEYKRIPILDNDNADIKEFLEPSFTFLSEKLNAFENGKGGATLVHCLVGSSRSATIVVYYLMRSGGLSTEQALNQLKSLRPIVNLNTRFLTPLQENSKKKEERS